MKLTNYWIPCSTAKGIKYLKLKVNIYNDSDLIGNFNIFKVSNDISNKFIIESDYYEYMYPILRNKESVYIIASNNTRFDMVTDDRCHIFINKTDIEYSFMVDIGKYIDISKIGIGSTSDTYPGCEYIDNNITITEYKLVSVDSTERYDYKAYIDGVDYNTIITFTKDGYRSSNEIISIYEDELYVYFAIKAKINGRIFTAVTRPGNLRFDKLESADTIKLHINSVIDLSNTRMYMEEKYLILNRVRD